MAMSLNNIVPDPSACPLVAMAAEQNKALSVRWLPKPAGSLLCSPDENTFHQTLCQHRPEAGVQLSFGNQARKGTSDSPLDVQADEKC